MAEYRSRVYGEPDAGQRHHTLLCVCNANMELVGHELSLSSTRLGAKLIGQLRNVPQVQSALLRR